MADALVDQIRAAFLEGLGVLDPVLAAMAQALTKELKPADRRTLCQARDYIARILARWRQGLADEPELLARVDSLAERIREIKGDRWACGRASNRTAPAS